MVLNIIWLFKYLIDYISIGSLWVRIKMGVKHIFALGEIQIRVWIDIAYGIQNIWIPGMILVCSNPTIHI